MCVVIFYAALMFVYDVPLTFAVIAVSLLNVAIIKTVARIRTDISRRLQLDKGKLMGTSMGGLQMIETLKATGGEAEFFGRWAGYQAKSLVGEQGLSVISETTGTVPGLVGTLATLIVYVMAGFKVMNGEFTIGMLVAYQTLVASFNRPLASLVSFSGVLQELRGDMTRLDDVIAYPQDPQYSRFDAAEQGEDRAALKLSGKVELRGITFGYSPLEPPLIEGFNLVVEPGRARRAGRRQRQRQVHGRQTGGGALRALGGRGAVRRRRRGPHLPRRLITNSVAVVDQEVFLFGGTITENVAMWDTTLSAGARDDGLPRRGHRRGDRGARGHVTTRCSRKAART